MSKEKLTKRVIDKLEARDKDYIVFDSELPGFGIRVMPSGKCFFLIQYRRHGRTRRVMIGQFGPVTAEIARKEAIRMLGSVRGSDGDPAAIRDRERQSATVKDLGERFLKEHVGEYPEFRVGVSLMGMKETMDGPTEGTCDPGSLAGRIAGWPGRGLGLQ